MDPYWQYKISRITGKNCSNKHVSCPKEGMARPNPLLLISRLVNCSHQEENLQRKKENTKASASFENGDKFWDQKPSQMLEEVYS